MSGFVSDSEQTEDEKQFICNCINNTKLMESDFLT